MDKRVAEEPVLAMCRGELPAGIFSPELLMYAKNRRLDELIVQVRSWATGAVSGAAFDRSGAIPPEILEGLGKMGVLGATIPESFGGLGLGVSEYARLAAELSYHDASLAITAGAHSSIATKGILRFGNEDQKRRFLPDMATGKWLGAFCLTEEKAGSDAQAIEAVAQSQGNGFLLRGRKVFSTNSGIAHVFTVFARDAASGKITAFLVTADQQGVERVTGADKLGLRGANVGTLELHDVRVSQENVLGKPGEGFRMALSVLNTGRHGLAASYLGTLRFALEQSIAHASQRHTFGQPLIENELIAAMIAEMGDHLYALEAMTYLAGGVWDSGMCEPGLEAALNKIYASEAAWRVADMAVQIHGGQGYMCDKPIERLLRDVRIGRIFEGTNEVLRLFVASKIMKAKAAPWKAVGERRKSAAGLADRAAAAAQLGLVWAQERTRERSRVNARRDELHDALQWEGRLLAEALSCFRLTTGKLLTRYPSATRLMGKQLHLARVADMALHCWRMTAVSARVNARRRCGQCSAEESATALRILSDSLRTIERLRVEISDDVGQDSLETASLYKKRGAMLFPLHDEGGAHG